jgi:anti-sigma factor RsiW
MSQPPPYDERLDAYLNGQLSEPERRSLEADLETSVTLRRELEVLRATRELLREALPDAALPEGLETRLRAALDAEDHAREAPAAPASALPHRELGRRSVTRWALAASLLLAVLATLSWLVVRPRGPADVVAAALLEHERGPAVRPSLTATTAEAVEARWQAARIGFPVRVLDLQAMGIFLAGGDAARLQGRLAARTDYRGGNKRYTCWMYEGRVDDLPPPDERRREGPFEFSIYRRGPTTLVFWQEGTVVCAFVGSGDSETVIRLAIGKAMLPPTEA